MFRSLHRTLDVIVHSFSTALALRPHLKAILTMSFNPIAENFLHVLLLYFFESFMTHVCSVYSPLCLIRGTRAVMAPLHDDANRSRCGSGQWGSTLYHAAFDTRRPRQYHTVDRGKVLGLPSRVKFFPWGLRAIVLTAHHPVEWTHPIGYRHPGVSRYVRKGLTTRCRRLRA